VCKESGYEERFAVMNFFKKLFGGQETKTEMPKDSVVTAPLSEVQLQSIKSPAIRAEPAQLIIGIGQSVGKQRELNEDSLLTFTSNIAGHFGNQPFGLYIIADGMGGHQNGEVASNTAIRTTANYILAKFHPYMFGVPAQQVEDPLQEIMQNAIAEAQKVVLREAPGSGTTLTTALVIGNQIVFGHVGDSRAYMFYQDGRAEVVTRDHSLVNRLIELGQITPAEAAVHPQRNVLYRALGQGEQLEADMSTIPFPPGGILMLCSDGLWGVISEDTLRRALNEARTSLTRAAQSLVNAANSAGGPDNISVILVQLLN
jgi:protein phosphatase